MRKIIGLGEILWDCLPTGKVLGGAPANFAYHATQFGFDGIAVSAIGNDELGQEILDILAEKQLNVLLEKVDFPTGTVQVTIDSRGIPQYEICENAAWDNIPFSPATENLAKSCDVVCFGSLAQRSDVSRNTILQFLELVPQSALKIFDINLRQHFYSKEVIINSLKKSNILKINNDEVKIVADLFGIEKMDEKEACMFLLKKYDLQMVVETKGEQGSYVFTKDETSFMETPRVQVADTVGAGDSFTGAFVAALLNGKTIREAHKSAVEVSAFVCTQHGAMPTLPSYQCNQHSKKQKI
jgi:fructokinase